MKTVKATDYSNWFLPVLGCFAFSFFWGNNTIVFSSLLTSDGFEALTQMLWRVLFLGIFALMFFSLKKAPLPVMFGMLGLQVCALIYDVVNPQSSAVPGPLLIALYSCYMSFFLLCFAFFFFSFPKKKAVALIAVSLLGSYVASTLLYEFTIPTQMRSLLNLCSTFTICLCLQNRTIVTIPSTAPSEGAQSTQTLRHQVQSFLSEVKSYVAQHPIMFSGSIALLLFVFEIWFQLNNTKTSATSEFSTTLFGIMCILAVLVLSLAYKVAEKNTIRFFPAVSLAAFLTSQIAVLLFWENTFLIMAIFTGAWFAMYQLVLMFYCQEATTHHNDVGFSTALYGLALAITMFVLVLGNGFARLFLWDLVLDYSVLSTLAFTMTVILVIALAIEMALYFRQVLANKQKSSQAEEESQARAIDALCERFQISPREREVMEIYIQGRSVNYIAAHLVVSTHTV
ncbi:MAG: LuxR C-terminal-related transcriptional regulator, partial [Raoultibacter sp.]